MGIENFGENNSLDKKLALNELSEEDLAKKLAEDAEKQKDLDKKLGVGSLVQHEMREAEDYKSSSPKDQKELNERLASIARVKIGKGTPGDQAIYEEELALKEIREKK